MVGLRERRGADGVGQHHRQTLCSSTLGAFQPAPAPRPVPHRGGCGGSVRARGSNRIAPCPLTPAPRRPRRPGTAGPGSGRGSEKCLGDCSTADLHIGYISCSSLAAPLGLRAGIRVGTRPISGPSGRVDGQGLAVTPPPARALPAARNEGDFAGCYYLFSAREGGRVLGAHRPGAEPMGRPLVTVRELGALGPSGVCQNGPTRTVLLAAQTTVPAVPRRIAVCTPLFSQGLDPLGVGHTGMYTGHLGLVGPDMGIGRCGDPPPPWALPKGATRGVLFVHFPRRPGGGVGVLTVAAQSRWVRTWRLCASAAFWDYAVYTESAAAQQWPRSKKWRLF